MADEKKTTRKKKADDPAEPEVEATQEAGVTVGEETSPEAPAAEPVAEEAPAAAEEPAVEEPAVEEPAVEEPAPVSQAPAVEEPSAAAAVEQAKRPRKRLPRPLRHKHSKPARERSAKRKPITRSQKPASEPGRRQERRGIVVSDKGEKTIVVKVDVTKAHPRYKKVVRRSQKFHAHDERNSAAIGDVVRIVETRPLSKTKHWRLAEIVERAK
jgi:small subunit ribosomal protein S17